MVAEFRMKVASLLFIGSILWFASSSSGAITRVPPVVSHHDHPDAVRPLAKQQMIREAAHVRPSQSSICKMEPLRLRGGQLNQMHQLRPEFIPQAW
jgi:hypothetical protein